MQDIRIDPNADPFSYHDPEETEPELYQLRYNDFDYILPDNITGIGEYHKGRISGSLP